MSATRDVVRPKLPRRAPARDAAATIVVKARDATRQIEAIGQQYERMGEPLTRLQNALAPYAERARAARDADARSATRDQRCTPAAVQAANAKRWGR